MKLLAVFLCCLLAAFTFVLAYLLIQDDHPWFALLLILCGAGTSLRWKDNE
jgi:hypothetical protein